MTRPRFSLAACLAGLLTTCKAVPAAHPARSAPPSLLPGMPAPLNANNVYAGAGVGMVAAAARAAKRLVYVPLGGAASVAVIDPATYRVERVFATATLPQHVVPAYDLRTL